METQDGETDLLPRHPPDFTFGRYLVRVVEGPDLGLERTCRGAELGVGTDVGNDLVLRDPAVSRHHLAIEATPDGYLLRDLGSTNGTRLAGYRIGWGYLEPGAIIG